MYTFSIKSYRLLLALIFFIIFHNTLATKEKCIKQIETNLTHESRLFQKVKSLLGISTTYEFDGVDVFYLAYSRYTEKDLAKNSYFLKYYKEIFEISIERYEKWNMLKDPMKSCPAKNIAENDCLSYVRIYCRSIVDEPPVDKFDGKKKDNYIHSVNWCKRSTMTMEIYEDIASEKCLVYVQNYCQNFNNIQVDALNKSKPRNHLVDWCHNKKPNDGNTCKKKVDDFCKEVFEELSPSNDGPFINLLNPLSWCQNDEKSNITNRQKCISQLNDMGFDTNSDCTFQEAFKFGYLNIKEYWDKSGSPYIINVNSQKKNESYGRRYYNYMIDNFQKEYIDFGILPTPKDYCETIDLKETNDN